MTRGGDITREERLELERVLIELYRQWPERKQIQMAARPSAFFIWLESRRPQLTRFGVFGARGSYQQISGLVKRWERLFRRDP
jgi:hypothetical protein